MVGGERVGVIGLGRLGLCVALAFERAGFEILGVEADGARAAAIRDRELRSVEPEVEDRLRAARRLHVLRDVRDLALNACERVFVVVATPSLQDGSYDHSQIDRIAEDLMSAGASPSPRDLVIVSTVMPGYTDRLAGRLAPGGWRVVYNPAFIALGSVLRNLEAPDLLLLGAEDAESADRISEVWRRVLANSPRIARLRRAEAEFAKIGLNSFLTLKIAFANALGDLVARTSGSPEAVLSAIGEDRRVGRLFLGYGFGYGGPCLPRDNRALNRAAADLGSAFPLGRAADDANQAHLDFQFETFPEARPDGSVFFDGVTYKPGSDSLEESQRLALAVRLARSGRAVTVAETAAVVATLKALFGDLFQYEVRPGV